MAEQTCGSAPAPLSLPDAPIIDWLRKAAKLRLAQRRKAYPAANDADAIGWAEFFQRNEILQLLARKSGDTG